MKKAFFVFLAFSLTSCLTSCTSKTYNTFYNQDTLSNYELTSEFPKRKSEKTCLKGEVNYFLYLDDKDYEDYSKEIYEYLCVNNYSYVGTYKQQGLVAEMLPNYCFLTIDESYDFTYSLHRFIY